MKNKLAITMLMLVTTGAAFAQVSSPNAPLATDNPYTDAGQQIKAAQAQKQHKEESRRQKPNCNVTPQSNATSDDTSHADRNASQDSLTSADAPQNQIEYGG